jgi:hypothetical protein
MSTMKNEPDSMKALFFTNNIEGQVDDVKERVMYVGRR